MRLAPQLLAASSLLVASCTPTKNHDLRSKPGAAKQLTEGDEGRKYVNSWSGLSDEIPASGKWSVKASSKPTAKDPVDEKPATEDPEDTEGPGTDEPNDDGIVPTKPNDNPDVVEFHIPKGTGRGAWNTQSTEVVAIVGKKFVIYNDDTIVHQWHTNGSPCQHGSPIRPGGSEECIPFRTFNNGSLYDHITQGRFYIKAQAQGQGFNLTAATDADSKIHLSLAHPVDEKSAEYELLLSAPSSVGSMATSDGEATLVYSTATRKFFKADAKVLKQGLALRLMSKNESGTIVDSRSIEFVAQ